jgi:UDP-galactopyranose mutase
MSTQHDFAVVGAGFSGAVLARELATRLCVKVLVIDERTHVAGNCHTERDGRTGVLVHRYGPHIFNTNREDVWHYVNRYGAFRPFTNRVKAVSRSGVYSLPVNLLTINQFFRRNFNPTEAREFIASRAEKTNRKPRNFEEQALQMIGRELYEEFFYGYTRKQWGCEPRELPASILKRLPVRFNYDDNYYATRFQGMPEEGYTALVSRILDHSGIEVRLGEAYDSAIEGDSRHVFYTGPIDRLFNYVLGPLGYRTVLFQRGEADGDYQGNAVINYTSNDVPYTRVHEHKHFAPWEEHERTVFFHETSKETEARDTPYYPKRLEGDLGRLVQYQELASQRRNVSFLGRLGTYRYLNMDQAIGEALDFADATIRRIEGGERIASFHEPVLAK